MYHLIRDDGAEFRLSGSNWESALELGFLYGWKPAGTQTPQTEAWRVRKTAAGPPVWDSQDYFSHESQHVGRDDARALAEAVLRALGHIPEGDPVPDDRRSPVGAGLSPTPVPSRSSAVADGLSGPRRKAFHRLAAFAGRGGFTIDLAL